MDFGFTPEQEALRQDVLKLCESWRKGDIKDPQQTTVLGQAHSPALYRMAAEKGFIGAALPKEYGGSELGYQALTLFQEEAAYQRLPLALSLSGTVLNFLGALIADCGSAELKKRFLPGLIRGEIRIAQHFSESEASSNLAWVKTRAIRTVDHYLVNGHKIYSSLAHFAEYGMVLVKTDPKAPAGQGISILLIDSKSPGITISPLTTIYGERCSQVFFDDVKVPAENLVGEENHGWECLSRYMHHSWDRRLGMFVGTARRALEDLISYTKETRRNNQPLSKDPLVRQKIAQLAIEIEGMRLLNFWVAWAEENRDSVDVIGPGAVSATFVNQFANRFANTAMQIMGLGGQLEPGSKHAPIKGTPERMYLANLMRLFSSGGISSTKNFIATHNLGLP